MASLRKRILPSGEIRWLVDYRDSVGTRRAKQFETKRDADAYMEKVRAEVAAGIHVADSQSVTLGEAADVWVEAGERDRLETTTVRQRRQHVDLHIKPLIGSTRLSRLNTPIVQEFVDKLLETRSRAMARRFLTSLKGILAEQRGDRSAAAKSTPPPDARQGCRALADSAEERPWRGDHLLLAPPRRHSDFNGYEGERIARPCLEPAGAGWAGCRLWGFGWVAAWVGAAPAGVVCVGTDDGGRDLVVAAAVDGVSLA